MRKVVLLCAVVCLCAVLGAAQEGKIASGWACSKPSPVHALEVGDKPGHTYAVQQVKCTATKGEIGGVKEKEGTATELLDISGDKVTGHGIFVETLASGDKMTVAYETTATTKNGQFQTGANRWHSTDATGKLKGVKAVGSCTAKGNPDGSAAFTCNGTYAVGK